MLIVMAIMINSEMPHFPWNNDKVEKNKKRNKFYPKKKTKKLYRMALSQNY